MRRAVSLLELVVVLGICTAIMLPVLDLSQRNMTEESELQERAVANGICLDAMERLKRYKTAFQLPREEPEVLPSTLLMNEMFMPVELVLTRATVFDRTYLAQIRSLGLKVEPEIKREEVKGFIGMFRLEVGTKWTSKKGHSREIRFVRYCYAP
jgi:hypothetical protein